MPESIPESLQSRIEERLRYYEDLGIRLFYRDRAAGSVPMTIAAPAVSDAGGASISEESSLPKPKSKMQMPVAAAPAPRVAPVMAPAGPSLFESVEKVKDDTLPRIREDLGRAHV